MEKEGDGGLVIVMMVTVKVKERRLCKEEEYRMK